MYMMKTLISNIKDYFSSKEKSPHWFFNLQDCTCISKFYHDQISLNDYKIYFKVYFQNTYAVVSMDVKILDIHPDLDRLRQLFINNIGHSYLVLYKDTDLKDIIIEINTYNNE